jgi:hypothetical protein
VINDDTHPSCRKEGLIAAVVHPARDCSIMSIPFHYTVIPRIAFMHKPTTVNLDEHSQQYIHEQYAIQASIGLPKFTVQNSGYVFHI